MRGPISDTDLPFVTAVPIRAQLPGMLLDDELLMALCDSLDDLLAPTAAALDCFGAYLDPGLAPEDFLQWLAQLVGTESSRESVATAVSTYADRGTAAGLRYCAAAAAGVSPRRVSVRDPGGVRWSRTARSFGARAGGDAASIRVEVEAAADVTAVTAAVRTAVESSRPVHCPVHIEVVSS